LHDEILDEMADLVVHERGGDGGLVTETFAEAARRVVFAAAFPRLEFARGADAALAGVQPQHDLAKGDLIKGDSLFVS